MNHLEFPPGDDPNQIENPAEIEPGFESLLQEIDYVDAGRDGIVFSAAKQKLSSDSLEFLTKRGVEVEDEKALKILKIYDRESARREFRAQRMAWELVSAAPESDTKEYAKIPKPYLLSDERISDADQQRLSSYGAKLTDRAGILFMDYIGGDDLMTRIARFVIKKKSPGSDEEAMKYMPQAAKSEAMRLLGVLSVGETAAGAYDREQSVRDAFLNVIGHFLRSEHEGFMQFMPPNFIERIENTLELLHKNNLYHNDLHEKNVMVTDTETYIIDFGRSGAENSTWESREGIGVNDMWLISFLKEALYFEKGYVEQDRAVVKNLAAFKDRLRGSAQLETLKKRLAAKGNIEGEMISMLSLGKFEQFAASILAIEEDETTPTELRSAIKDFKKGLSANPALKRSNTSDKRIAKTLAEAA